MSICAGASQAGRTINCQGNQVGMLIIILNVGAIEIWRSSAIAHVVARSTHDR